MVNVAFTRKSGLGSSVLYACWLEDESGNDIQNLYVCKRLLKNELFASDPEVGNLTGTAIPNWKTKKYAVNSDVDGVTGASSQGPLSFTRTLAIGSVTRFRVCFEIDRSWNANETYFKNRDRPAYTYKSGLINLSALAASYPLALDGWMSNDTDSGDLSQQPSPSPSGYAPYVYMTDLSCIAPSDDLVEALLATVSPL
jgi:hypothetical protein